MWVHVAVWQLCDLLYTCYLLTRHTAAVIAMCLCLSVISSVSSSSCCSRTAVSVEIASTDARCRLMKEFCFKRLAMGKWPYRSVSVVRNSSLFDWLYSHLCVSGSYAFSSLTLLFGRQEGHPACKNWVVWCWRGYLSGARCRLAYGPADATATHCLLLQ